MKFIYQQPQIICFNHSNVLRNRIITFFIFMGLFSLLFQIGAISEVDDAESNTFVQEFLSDTQEITGIEIFQNNSIAALPMFIPGLGIALGLHTAWSTGFGFAAMVSVAPGLSDILPLSLLYGTLFGLIELIAYSIALSRSFHIVLVLVKRVKLKSLLKPTVIEISVVLVLLLMSGILEEYLIELSKNEASLFG